jgi:hypothetical protein
MNLVRVVFLREIPISKKIIHVLYNKQIETMSNHNFVHCIASIDLYPTSDINFTYVTADALVNENEIAQNFSLTFDRPLMVETTVLHIPVLPAQNMLTRYTIGDTQDAHIVYFNPILTKMGQGWQFYEHILPFKEDLCAVNGHLVCVMMDNPNKTIYRLECVNNH